MKEYLIKKEIINIISKCQIEFEKNLKNQKLLFIYENKNKTIGIDEMYFPMTSFYHLTGINVYNAKNVLLNSSQFYKLLANGGIDIEKIKTKDKTTFYKLQILQQLMKIDKLSGMIGNFKGNNLFLQTSKIVGNVNCCMGFVKNNKSNMYIPNTVLKVDIRDITDNRKNIIAILKKNVNDKKYKNITYMKQKYEIIDILSNQEITDVIDVKNIYSQNLKIISKIKKYKEFIQLEENK